MFHRTWTADCGLSGRPLVPAQLEGTDPSSLTKRFDADGNALPRRFNAKAEYQSVNEPRRWTRARKKEHFENFDKELAANKCHDEMFAVGNNAKMWTHLNNHGVSPGGFGPGEMLDPAPERKSGKHLKSGLYKGRWENVKPAQLILRGKRPGKKVDLEQQAIDTRRPFDNRLKDDMIRRNDNTNKELSTAGYELFRPVHTRSCPEMGAEWVNR